MKIQVRRNGVAPYPWTVTCQACPPREITHIVPGFGVVALNTPVGNSQHETAIAAASAHIARHRQAASDE